MTKKDLRDGMIVETHAGNRYLVMNGCRVARRVEGYIKLTDQEDNLTYRFDDEFTIDKVYENGSDVYSLKYMFEHPGKLLWERSTTKEMTLEEIEKELGYKVKVVGTAVKHEFKVGDKVRTTKLRDGFRTELFPIGSVCTIDKIDNSSYVLPYLLRANDGSVFWYDADMFEPYNREFEVGDEVRIRQWDDMAEEFGVDKEGVIKCYMSFIKNMKHLCGRKCRITSIDGNRVKLDFGKCYGDTAWNYSTDMIEHI